MKQLFFFAFLLFACGVPESEYQALQQKVDSLTVELEKAKAEVATMDSGPAWMLSEAKKYIQENKPAEAMLTLEALLEMYPTDMEASEASILLSQLQEDAKGTIED